MASLKSGDCRYVGRILRPSKSPADGGREGQPQVVVKEWFFSNENRNGREISIAQQMVPLVTHILRGWNPGARVEATDYVEFEGRRLNIAFADDLEQNGMVLKLICIEQQ